MRIDVPLHIFMPYGYKFKKFGKKFKTYSKSKRSFPKFRSYRKRVFKPFGMRHDKV